MTDYKKFVENSRKWLADYIKNNHLQSIIIGISGGIDSTVSCAIAYPVCKELNIALIGRSLPTFTNKNEETTSANLIGSAFCTDYKEVNLEAIYKDFNNLLFDEEGIPSNLQRGNIKARLRMIYLRYLASVHKGVVLDNSNFTEWNLGFWTVGGDSMDINFGLHYLWKTETYELADYLADEYMKSKVPIEHTEQSKAILASMKLTPTDGNGVSKSDCEQFGLDNYEQVDDVLKTIYFPSGKPDMDKNMEYVRLIKSYNKQGIDKVTMLHQNTEFKRKSTPIMPTREELEL